MTVLDQQGTTLLVLLQNHLGHFKQTESWTINQIQLIIFDTYHTKIVYVLKDIEDFYR